MTQGEALIHVAPPQRLLAPHVAKAPTDHRRRQMQPCPPRNETVGTWEPSWSSWESLKHFFLTSIMKKIRINVSVFQSDHIQLMSNVYIYIYIRMIICKKNTLYINTWYSGCSLQAIAATNPLLPRWHLHQSSTSHEKEGNSRFEHRRPAGTLPINLLLATEKDGKSSNL